ncbi:DUF983 domain-containing protein [Sphingomonas oryzagri]
MTDTESFAERNWKKAVLSGMADRCPACGQARLFARGLRTAPHCPACGQDWSAQRADDFPAYLVILILGHVLVPIVVAVNIAWDVPLLPQMIAWSLLAIAIAVLMIRPAKGAVIGAQWALRMGGFGKR